MSAFTAWSLYRRLRWKRTAILVGGVVPSTLMQLWSLPLWQYDDMAAGLTLGLVAMVSFVMLLIDFGVAYLILHDEA